MIGNITKKAWIISGGTVLIIVILGLTVWPFSIINFKKEEVAKESNIESRATSTQEVQGAFTKDNVARGEYRNDAQSAGVYVDNTQEVQIAVVVNEATQKIVGDTTKVSCGNIAFVTKRVMGPAVLTNSLKALFENKVETDFAPGNIIPTYHPELTLEKVMIDAGVAKVYLGGNFSGKKDGLCDANLAIAQIVETAKTFKNVTSVEVYQGDKKVY